MGASRASATALAAALGGVLLVTVLVTWAASIGPSGVLTGEGPQAVRTTPTEAETSSSNPVERLRDDTQDELEKKYAGDHPVLRAIAIVLEVLAGILAIYLLYRAARWAKEKYDARRRPPPDPDELDFDVLGEPGRVVEQIEVDAAHQRQVLLEGNPRNAIVECWHRFELQAADAGLARQSWETSSEFTLRMLDLAGADSHAVAELAALYREARFSEHPLGEDARTAALAALDAVHRGLGIGRVP